MPSFVVSVAYLAVLHGSLSLVLEGVHASLLDVLTGSCRTQSVLGCAEILALLNRCC
jgi:hypothetical protein